MTCEEPAQRCVSLIWSYEYDSATWSPDSQTVHFEFEEITCDAGTCINSPTGIFSPVLPLRVPPPGATLVSALMSISDRPDAKPQKIALPYLPLACDAYSPKVSLDGTRLAITLGPSCRMKANVLVTDLAGNNPQEVPFGTLYCRQTAWSHDGNAIYCLPHRDERVLYFDLAKKQLLQLNIPQDSGFELQSFTESTEGKGKYFVVALVSKADQSTDLYLFDDATEPKSWRRLTTDGFSFRPAF